MHFVVNLSSRCIFYIKKAPRQNDETPYLRGLNRIDTKEDVVCLIAFNSILKCSELTLMRVFLGFVELYK